MALITCPHCGKNVSDSVETCIHCGGSLRDKSVPEKEREYAALPLEEQKSLRKEFEQKYPDVAVSDRNVEKLNKKRKILLNTMIYIVCALAIVSLIFEIVELTMVALIGMCLALIFTIVLIIVIFYPKKYVVQRLTNLKCFQVWLKQEKNVHYSAILNEKERKMFEQITLD